MEYQNIFKIIDEFEQLLTMNEIRIKDYDIQKLNKIICRLEDTYKK